MSEQQLPAADVDIMLAAAVAAPSKHSTRPCRFEVKGHVVDVFRDGSHPDGGDPTGRATRLAAGAATFNLRCAAESLGYSTWYGLAPYPEEPDLLARVVIEPTDTRNEALADLAQEIPERHTDRDAIFSGPLTEATRIALLRAAYADHAELTWLDEPQIQAVLGTDEACPDIAVLSTPYDEPHDQVAAGAALEHVLLTATRAGVSASFINQPLDSVDFLRKVQDVIQRPGHAHLIIRFAQQE